MKALERQAPPAFWIDRVCRWIDLLAGGEVPAGNKLHDWSSRSGSIESLLDRAAEGPYRFLAP